MKAAAILPWAELMRGLLAIDSERLIRNRLPGLFLNGNRCDLQIYFHLAFSIISCIPLCSFEDLDRFDRIVLSIYYENQFSILDSWI